MNNAQKAFKEHISHTVVASDPFELRRHDFHGGYNASTAHIKGLIEGMIITSVQSRDKFQSRQDADTAAIYEDRIQLLKDLLNQIEGGG